ncbi:PilN domain-containing protein [Irregularibacter muris]|uniref:PilN domain-containing protein n=1 Tax=Irregularibacter muris TaxID=1796619 RepID=A0AAE3HEF3_9FIRM|nr:PilN domain-containing protein [Irregularibacter muris]MCR1897980.1 PilN domain-containing protein [Irregularibacter muris]
MKEMNLLPKECLDVREQKKKRKLYIGGVTTFIFLLMVTYGGMFYMNYKLNKDIININSEIQELQAFKEIQSQVIFDKEILQRRKSILRKLEVESKDHYAFFVALKNTVPDEITLESISHPTGNHYNLTAKATKPDKIADFMINLAKIKGVKDVMLDHVQYGESMGEEKRQSTSKFSINFTYQFGGDHNESK